MVDAGEIEVFFRNVLFSHPNTTAETDLTEHLLLVEKDTHHLDLSNLTQQTTIRVFEKIDGVVYKQLSSRLYPDDYELGTQVVIVILDGAGQDMKITLQSSVAEGAARAIGASVRDEIRQ